MDFRGTLESETEALGRELNWAIRPESGLGLAEIVDALVEDRWYQDGHLIGDLRVAYLLTEKMAQDAPEVVRSTTSYHQVGDLSVVCARVPQILYMKQGMDLVQGDNPRGDVYLIFFESSSFIANQTRHPDEKRVPVLPFVRSKGGNGRGNGGGLNFPIPTDAKNYESVRDRLLGEFQEFLSHPEVIARWYSE